MGDDLGWVVHIVSWCMSETCWICYFVFFLGEMEISSGWCPLGNAWGGGGGWLIGDDGVGSSLQESSKVLTCVQTSRLRRVTYSPLVDNLHRLRVSCQGITRVCGELILAVGGWYIP